MKTILQIVPKPPGPFDGVGDYALTLARQLRDLMGHETVFAAHRFDGRATINGFEVFPLRELSKYKCVREHTILHYVNYGYQRRGTPLTLVPLLSRFQRTNDGQLLTIFHELYASGPPWSSAFWLGPVQKQIVRSLAKISSACVVSSESMLDELRALSPETAASVHPVISNFGEPALSVAQIEQRDPQHWAICGGTALVERSLRSFTTRLRFIPANFPPRKLIIAGGSDNPATRALISNLREIEVDYRPNVSVSDASELLSGCSFMWLDYFHRPNVPTVVLLKSTAFAAACAHAVIPVLPHEGSAISLGNDLLPGPFFVDRTNARLPALDQRARIAAAYFDWYRRHCSSETLAGDIAHVLGLAPAAVRLESHVG